MLPAQGVAANNALLDQPFIDSVSSGQCSADVRMLAFRDPSNFVTGGFITNQRLGWVLTFSGYDTNADGLLQDLEWENLETQRQIHQAITVYKSINGLAPEYLRSKFVDCGSVSDYSLRDTVGKLAVPFPRTNYLRNSFSYNGAAFRFGITKHGYRQRIFHTSM